MARTLFSRLCSRNNLRENKVLANKKCSTVIKSLFAAGEELTAAKGETSNSKSDVGSEADSDDVDELSSQLGELQIPDFNNGQNVSDAGGERGPTVAATTTVHSDSDFLVANSTPAGKIFVPHFCLSVTVTFDLHISKSYICHNF